MRPKSDVPALQRALQTLEAVREAGSEGLSPAKLIERVSAPRASLYRIVRELLEAGLLAQDAHTGRYRLGRQSVYLGFSARANDPLVLAAQPLLKSITQQTHEMSELIVAVSGTQLITLEVWQAEQTPLRFRARAGMLFPVSHTTAHGLIYLSYAGERRMNEYLSSDLGKAAPAGLIESCERWRKLGYAWLRQKTPLGNARLSVPVFDPRSKTRRVAATLGVACDSAHIDGLQAARWAPILQARARELEKAL
ncbi:MAG TPA: IclR family transcriptional regulator C-terminal domain-containing protein [Planctomycetota bacterium]|nr:IclR family transcriptional regulator C-terminal domain-containing protein [Planctomycetota bacterium]